MRWIRDLSVDLDLAQTRSAATFSMRTEILSARVTSNTGAGHGQ